MPEMTSPMEGQDRSAGFMSAGVFYPTLHPLYEGHHLLQKRERKLIIITDPDDCDRDMMAELYGVKMSALLTTPPKRPECSIAVKDPVPPRTTPPKEAEPNTAPASETRSQKKTREPVRFFIPLTEEEKEEAKKANIVFGDVLSDHLTLTGGDIVEAPAPLQTTPPKEVEPNTAAASETRSQKKTREPVRFFIPLTEEEKEEAKKANIVFGALLSDHLTLTGGDIVEAPVHLQATSPKEAEPNIAPASETRSQKKTREPVRFFIPLTEEEKEEAKKANIVFGDVLSDHLELTGGDIVEAPAPVQTTPPKEAEPNTAPASETRSQKKSREPVRFFMTEEEKEKAKKANIIFGDVLSDHLELTGGDIVEAPAPLQTTPPKEAEPNNTLELAPVEVQPSELHPAATPSNQIERKKYDREFLLRLRFVSASMRRPEGFPDIPGVVLDKQCDLKKPNKIITRVSLNDDVQLDKAEKAWKPAAKKSRGNKDDQEMVKTQELFKRVRSILNKLTPEMFQQLMKRFMELTIDTEERLKGVVDLIFEKAISEPNFSVTYANMCRCFVGLKVPTSDNSGATVSFHRLLLNRCQKEFEKDKGDDEIFQQKQKELDAATEEEVEQRLNEARRRSLGNIKFIGELFKLKMVKEQIMHVCIVKLLKNHEESLEVLCRLLSTIGKNLDLEESKPCMDQYFQQMEQIVKERKTSSRIRFMLQDVLDLRKNNWVPRRGDQGPKTIDQIHKDAELEEQRELIKVQQLLQSKKNSCQERRGKMNHPQDEGWNAVPNRTMKQPIDTPRLTEPDAGQSAMCTLNRFSVLHQSGPSSTSCSSSLDSKCRVPQDQGLDRKGICKPALSEEEVEKKTTAIIEEYLHINDLKEAVQCVEELNSASVLFVFVRNAVELTLERSTVARERLGLLLHELISTRILPPEQYFRGLREILEVADDMAIDIPHIWQYLAEIITPMLHDGGIPMGPLFRELTKPLLPIGKAAVLLVHILNRLVRGHNKAGALWIDAELNWKDFLPEDEDVNKFVAEQKVEFTLKEKLEKLRKKELRAKELSNNI
ncbi:eukaryotic translation initiation factor 4 gamma 3-like [Hemibagrus wyckioides]|uniref:eukaryotic translation initiation factor 4 gamma 3-like n=1 Tax=Hemibagrus wyckioides TaxID=337641 RepID=UPI00266CCFCC|nr:eukaryotic translation initiation factor 4 gamma 3-like [Hemibagrus wyckioides]